MRSRSSTHYPMEPHDELPFRSRPPLSDADAFRAGAWPRQLPPGIVANPKSSPRRLSVATRFLTDAKRLERHLPEGFTLAGEPIVSIEFHYLTEIDWLAGRGYSMIHVGWPATFAQAMGS